MRRLTGLMKIPVCVFNWTTRTKLSLPSIVCIMRASGLHIGGVLSSLMITISSTAVCTFSVLHLFDNPYLPELTNHFVYVSSMSWQGVVLWWRWLGYICDGSSDDGLKLGVKCSGVKARRSLISVNGAVRGRELRLASIWVRKVVKALVDNLVDPIFL